MAFIFNQKELIMRILNLQELEQVAGGAPKWDKIPVQERAEPGTDVTPHLSGNRTGWCRGYGNMKNGVPKHAETECGIPS
jgi:hypothetical protein